MYIYDVCIYSVEDLQRWWRNQRSEFGRLKDRMRSSKSGKAPEHWTLLQKWRWETFKFLFDEIQSKHKGEHRQVGICIQHTPDLMLCTHFLLYV